MQPERKFENAAQQQPVYRFPQNQPDRALQPQHPRAPMHYEAPRLSNQDKRMLKHRHKRKIFTLWNLFAVIGIVTVIIQFARYVLIPLLVYLNAWTGGIQ